MKSYELIAFDIDGTLTESKQPIDKGTADLLTKLLDKYKVAIISGAHLEQFKWQILDHLSLNQENSKNLYLLPVDGTVFCNGGDENCHYDEPLDDEVKDRVRKAFENIYEESGVEKPEKTYGLVIEDRGAQLNFSAFGQDAPKDLKDEWDIDNKKREKMVKILKEALPDLSFHIGGTTSIEITKQGIDKAYGLNKLMMKTGLPKDKILYVGDKIFPGGNDEPALKLGLKCEAVKSLEDTKSVIIKLLSS